VFDSIDLGEIVRNSDRPIVKLFLTGGLVFYFTYHLTGFHLFQIWPPVPSHDAAIQFERAREIFAHGSYASPPQTSVYNAWPYPPSAVLLFRGLEILGPGPFMVVWIALMIGGLLVTFRASVAGEEGDLRAAWLLLGAASLVFVDSSVSWDLRKANGNLVYLGLCLAGYGSLRQHRWFAGAMVGLSMCLKLYSALLLLWLMVRGPRRALYSATITILLLWLLLPLAIFRVDGVIRMYHGWYEQLKIVNDPAIYTVLAARGHGPPLVTLRRAAMTLTGTGATEAATRTVLLLLWASWLIALLWYMRRTFAGERAEAPSRSALADWTILMLAPLPFSPWLEPYHAVPVVPAAILCLETAFDGRVETQLRSIPLVALSALLAMRLIFLPFGIRALGLLAQFIVLVIALGLLRPHFDRRLETIACPTSPRGLSE